MNDNHISDNFYNKCCNNILFYKDRLKIEFTKSIFKTERIKFFYFSKITPDCVTDIKGLLEYCLKNKRYEELNIILDKLDIPQLTCVEQRITYLLLGLAEKE